MTPYEITFARSARRELEALDAATVSRIWERVQGLANGPRPGGCRKLRGEERHWRIRVGDYRVLYAIHDEKRIVDIIAVRHRRDAYR